MSLMKKAYLCFMAFCLLAAVFAGSAAGESSTERKIEILREQMDMLQEQMEILQKKIRAIREEVKTKEETASNMIEKQKKQDAVLEKQKAQPVLTFWKNDFFLSTPDENFWMKIRGNLHFDSKFYGGNSNNPTEFDVRRARMDFQGMWYKYIYFRVQAEFADSPYIRNA